jgi:hypothetical protein
MLLKSIESRSSYSDKTCFKNMKISKRCYDIQQNDIKLKDSFYVTLCVGQFLYCYAVILLFWLVSFWRGAFNWMPFNVSFCCAKCLSAKCRGAILTYAFCNFFSHFSEFCQFLLQIYDFPVTISKLFLHFFVLFRNVLGFVKKLKLKLKQVTEFSLILHCPSIMWPLL